MSAALVLEASDPRVDSLIAAGHRIVGESWGARLRVTDPDALAPARLALAAARAQGFTVRELDAEWTDAIAALDALSAPDYPVTPATPPPHLPPSRVAEMLGQGARFFGAIDREGNLVAITAVSAREDRVETEFTSVHPHWRRRGLAVAVKGASLLALVRDGATVFGTGGAQLNAGSIAMNERLGYELKERWLSLAPPSGT